MSFHNCRKPKSLRQIYLYRANELTTIQIISKLTFCNDIENQAVEKITSGNKMEFELDAK